ncbi:MAG: hypothetical protein HY080_04220 [Gammaproteobacteria bacterium]|nr:hypothetical protein [Gammaproteobacteria bacterium]
MEKFDTHPASIDKWLHNLPLGSTGETARQLFQALRTVNAMEDIPVKNLFHFMEGIAPPLRLVLTELHKHYAGKPLPLSPKRRKVASLYSQLLDLAIAGNQRVITSSVELVLFGWKKLVTTAVHRILYYHSLMLCNYRLLYLPLPRGGWQQLYMLYQLIEKHELLDSKVACLVQPSVKTSLLDEYKKLLLVSMLAPNLFKLKELQSILNTLNQFAAHTTLGPDQPGTLTHVYAFLTDLDLAPGLFTGTNPATTAQPQIRYFDVTPLTAFIQRQITQYATQISGGGFWQDPSANRRTLLVLLNTWARPPARDGERRAINGQVELAVGTSAIHYLLNEGRDKPKTGSVVPTTPSITKNKIQQRLTVAKTTTLDTPSDFNSMGFATDREGVQDVWNTAYFEPEPPPPSWTESISMKAYSYMQVKIINVSKGGYCIAIPQEGIQNIQAGEFVALRGKNATWQLGEIRWMVCPSVGPIRAGIKRLCQQVYPAQLNISSPQQQLEPIRCLLGESGSAQLTLFMPLLPIRMQGLNVAINYNGHNHHFVFDSATSVDTLQGFAYQIRLQNEAPPPALPGLATAAVPDKFAQVWSSL